MLRHSCVSIASPLPPHCEAFIAHNMSRARPCVCPGTARVANPPPADEWCRRGRANRGRRSWCRRERAGCDNRRRHGFKRVRYQQVATIANFRRVIHWLRISEGGHHITFPQYHLSARPCAHFRPDVFPIPPVLATCWTSPCAVSSSRPMRLKRFSGIGGQLLQKQKSLCRAQACVAYSVVYALARTPLCRHATPARRTTPRRAAPRRATPRHATTRHNTTQHDNTSRQHATTTTVTLATTATAPAIATM